MIMSDTFVPYLSIYQKYSLLQKLLWHWFKIVVGTLSECDKDKVRRREDETIWFSLYETKCYLKINPVKVLQLSFRVFHTINLPSHEAFRFVDSTVDLLLVAEMIWPCDVAGTCRLFLNSNHQNTVELCTSDPWCFTVSHFIMHYLNVTLDKSIC